MTEAGSKSEHMIIIVETATGKVIEPVLDEHGNEATEVTPQKLEDISLSQAGFKYVGTILHAHSSPGCVYLILPSGRRVKVCY
jgi:hypothetical protein